MMKQYIVLFVFMIIFEELKLQVHTHVYIIKILIIFICNSAKTSHHC